MPQSSSLVYRSDMTRTKLLSIAMLDSMFVKIKAKKDSKKGRARDRTGIAGIRIQSDDHYTTQPVVVIVCAAI